MADEARANDSARAGGPLAFRGRGFLLGCFFAVPVTYLGPNVPQSAMFSLLAGPVALLLALAALNIPLRRWLPRIALNQADMILIYAITTVAGASGGEWLHGIHTSIHTYPIHEGDPAIKNYLLPQMPDWLVVKDMAAVSDIHGGGKDMAYVWGKLGLYGPRYLGWAAIVCSAAFAMLCINSLMRGAWTQREKLSFPLIQLPVALTEKGGSGPMWQSRYLWIAFAVMFAVDILNGLNYLYPNLPRIPVKDWLFVDALFKDPPLSNMGDFRLSLYPFMAAIAIFMPSDLMLSIVVFYLLRKASHIALAANGVPQETFSGTFVAPGPPYFDEQTWGGVLALFVGAIWVSRGYLREVWRDIRTGRAAEDGGLRHRWAFVGLIVCFCLVVWFGMLGELPIAYMVPYVALFLIFSIVLTRIRAQLGPPTHEFAFLGPSSIMHRFLGNQWLTDKQAAWTNQVFLFMNRIHRTHPMPHQLESLKMGTLVSGNRKLLFVGLFGATALGILLTLFFLHAHAYRLGVTARNMDGVWFMNSFAANRHGPDIVGIVMTLFGFGMVVGLDAIRFRVPGFPLHPAGYVLSMNYGVDYYWFGLLLAMMVRNFVQRYYGLRGYDKLRHVALGILVAEYAAEAIWMTMALTTHQSTYTISFNDRSLGAQ
jgi:hypothetical protein